MVIWSIFPLLSSVAILLLGCYVFFRNTQGILHRLFIMLCAVMSIVAFSEYELRSSETMQSAMAWLTASMIWPFAAALLVHFVVVLTENTQLGKRYLLLSLLYIPAAIAVLGGVMAKPPTLARAPWGWSVNPAVDPWILFQDFWAAALGIIALGMCAQFYLKAPSLKMKKIAKHVLIGLSFPIILGIVTQVILPLISIRAVELTASSSTIFCIFVAYAIRKYDLFALTPAAAAESIISTMNDALFLVSSENIIEHCNNSAVKLLGYEQHELRGHPVKKIFPPYSEEGETRHLTFEQVLSSGMVSDVETYFQTRAGKRIPVSLSWSTTRNTDGQVIGTTFIARDITERIRMREAQQKAKEDLEKRVEERTRELSVSNDLLRREISERLITEEKLAAEKEYLSVSLRSIGDGVITTDKDGLVSLVNNVAAELTGWPAQESKGKPLDQILSIIDEATRQPGENLIEAITRAGDVVRSSRNVILKSRDGIERVITQSGAPIRDSGGKVRGYVVVFHDLSEKKRLADEAYKTHKLESLAALAGGIAHDFNNILTSIMTNLFVARMQVPPKSEAADLLSETEKAAFRASSLTKQLLTFSKGTAPIRVRCNIREVVEECAGFCLGKSKVDYQIDAAPDLYDVEVDRGQIDQALTSIITNAEQAMPTGTIRIQMQNVTIGPDHIIPLAQGSYVSVNIKDEGRGIPQQLIHTIFDPYFTTKTNASGLGLSTAYSIVKNHDGCITVDSEEGKGSTFILYLPAALPAEEKAAAKAQERPVMKGKGKLLLMDDEEYIRSSTGKLLSMLGYEVVTTKDGDEAVASFQNALEQKAPFDLVILDLTVSGGMGGTEAVQKIRTFDPGIYAVVSSGYANDPIMADYQKHGFQAAIAKPYEIGELSELLQRTVKGKPEQSSNADAAPIA